MKRVFLLVKKLSIKVGLILLKHVGSDIWAQVHDQQSTHLILDHSVSY